MNDKRTVAKCTLHIDGANYEFIYSEEEPIESGAVFIFTIQVRDNPPCFRAEYRDITTAVQTMQEMATRFQINFPLPPTDIDAMELCNDNPPPAP